MASICVEDGERNRCIGTNGRKGGGGGGGGALHLLEHLLLQAVLGLGDHIKERLRPGEDGLL